jgi:excisionase family DNA binding protein
MTLTTRAAAEKLGLSRSTLEKMRVYGTGPYYLKLGRAVRYKSEDLDDWLLRRRVASTSHEVAQ